MRTAAVESLLQEHFSDQNLAKETIDEKNIHLQLVKLVKIEQKCFLSQSAKWVEKRFNSHIRWKTFHAKSDEKQKIFFYTPVSKFQKISTLNICDGAKQIYPKKEKVLRKDTLRISVAAEVYSKKGVLQNSPPVYWYITKIYYIHHVQNPW